MPSSWREEPPTAKPVRPYDRLVTATPQRRVLPTGTVTFLFTDIEGSTRLLQALGHESFAALLAGHDAILRTEVDGRGVVVKTIGDGFFAAFADPIAAVAAASSIQRRIAETMWPRGALVKVRMGLHTGAGILGGDDYIGLDVHRSARIAGAANGGQIVVSATTAELIGPRLPDGVTIRELGTHLLRDLTRPERLFEIDVAGLAHEFPPLRTADVTSISLPAQATSFIGRDVEVREVAALLERARLVTLTGPGGTGKTRLAIAVAARVAPSFPDGVSFVPLETVTDPDLLPTAILETLELHTTAANVSPADHLLGYLRGKRTMLVLDNVEQILPCAAFIARLVESSPGVALLVTSRAPLRIAAEHDYPVPPLAVPRAEAKDAASVATNDAVALFTDRAGAVRPDFAVTDASVAKVAEITRRLDGLPLAIELAASRVRLLTLDAILERLDNRLLAAGGSDMPPRQRTITTTIGWSYDLLTQPVRRLFERCSVFIGGATLTDIEAVCGPPEELGVEVLDGLEGLVEQSLLRLTVSEGEPRYQMLVVVREYARAALVVRGHEAIIARRHATVFADLAARAAPFLLTSEQARWLDRLTTDHDNLRAALEWSVAAGEVDLALGMVADLWRYWQIRGHLHEAEERIDLVLAMEGGDPRLRARALEARGGVAYWRGATKDAVGPYEQSLALMRQHGDARDVANALYNASFPISHPRDRDRAERYLAESLELAEATDDRLGVGRAYWGLCNLAAYDQRYDQTIRYATLASTEFEALDAPFDLGWTKFMLAQGHFLLGRLGEARRYLDAALLLFVAARDLSAIVLVLYLKTAVLVAEGSDREAAPLLGALETLKLRTGATIADVEQNQYEPVRMLMRDPRDDIQSAIARGRRMGVDEALALASSL